MIASNSCLKLNSFSDSSCEIADLINVFGEVNVSKAENENSFAKLINKSIGKEGNIGGCRKANSEVQQRLKDLQKPSCVHRTFPDVMQQHDYSPSDLQALNDYYANQTKSELDAKYHQLVKNQGSLSGKFVGCFNAAIIVPK